LLDGDSRLLENGGGGYSHPCPAKYARHGWGTRQFFLAGLQRGLLVRFSGAHEDEGALGEGGVDEQGGAGEGEAVVDVVEEEEWGERPEDVKGEEDGPDFEEFGADCGGVEEGGGEEEGADGDEEDGGDDHEVEDGCGVGERGHEVFNFGEVGERSDVKAEVHELEEEVEGLNDGGGGLGQVGGVGEESAFGDCVRE